MHNSKKSNTGSAKTSLLLVACAMAVVFFMILFTVISPTTAQTAPAAVVLPTGQWEIHKNGYIGTLTIDNVGADGVVTGRLEVPPDPPDAINGFYNETTGNLTFYRIINQQDRSSNETYVGFVFRDGSPFAGTPDRMAGYFCIACEFIGLPPAGEGNQEQNIWGWYAILKSTQGTGTTSLQQRPGGGTITAPGGTGGTTTTPPSGGSGGGTTTPQGGSGSVDGISARMTSITPRVYEGPCPPPPFQFSGEITDSRGGRDITYRFDGTDGATEPRTIHFDAPGTQQVSEPWQTNQDFSTAQQFVLEITSPIQLRSNTIEYEQRCTTSSGGSATGPTPGGGGSGGGTTGPAPAPGGETGGGGGGGETGGGGGGGETGGGQTSPGDPTVDPSPPQTIEGDGGGGTEGGDPTVDPSPPQTIEGN